MITCTRTFGFDYGHRVLGHEGKCASLHGHRGLVEVTCQAADLDHLGRVIDFSEVKRLVGTWIDEHWDHTMLLHHNDPLIDHLNGRRLEMLEIIGPRRPFVMDCNPTAEHLAALLFNQADVLLKPIGIRVTHVKFWETPNCFACCDASGPAHAQPREVEPEKSFLKVEGAPHV